MRNQEDPNKSSAGFLMDDDAIRARQTNEIPLFGATPAELAGVYNLSLRETRGDNSRTEPLSALTEVRTVVLFVGQGRSGHSLVGALLDAHPDCLIAHELNACSFIDAGFDRDQIYYLIWQNSRHFAKVGRRWGRYSYEVPGACQGRYRRLSVIGDKKGGSTADYLFQNPSNIGLITGYFGVPVRFVHVVRAPLDNIAAMALQAGGSAAVDGAIQNYTRRCVASARLIEAQPDAVITLHHEDVLSQSQMELAKLAQWLKLEADPLWLEACARVVKATPSRSRDRVGWSPSQRDAVRRLLSQHSFLRRYDEDV